MKYIYGLNVNGQSIIKYFYLNKVAQIVWDDNEEIRNLLKTRYKNLIFVHPEDLDCSKISEVFVSPGISLKNNVLNKLKSCKLTLFRDLELYSRLIKNQKIIAITGTNGKSTTVKIINDIIKNNGLDCFVGGNFGTPLMDFINQKIKSNYHVIELSSYQLEAAPSFRSYISVLLNISEDHLDRYDSIEEYAYNKEKIICSKDNYYSIISLDDFFCKKIYKNNISKKIIPISTTRSISDGIYLKNNIIYDNFFDKKEIILDNLSVSLNGEINYQNILASYAVSKILNFNENIFLSTLKNFNGLPHRFEYIFENKKMLIINNSKATNFDSAMKTIKNFENVFLILGGRIKNNDFSIFKKLKNNISRCFVIGESTEMIHNQVSNFFQTSKSFNMEKAIEEIFLELKNIESKVNIILAPACSSFDQFVNFEERGKRFKELIMKKISFS